MESHSNDRARIEKAYDFPTDLLLEVFVFLPVKSLCRFKCISKFWNSVIQDQAFINRRKTSLLWQIDDETNYLSIYSIDSNGFATLEHQYKFAARFSDLQVCSGLLCYNVSKDTIAVFNTFTKKAFPLPRFANKEFGFDVLSMRYKLVGWVDSDEDRKTPFEFRVLVLDKNCLWKHVNNNLGLLSLPDDHFTVGGTVYWLDVVGGQIILFNLGTEEFRAIELPSGIDTENFIYHMFEFEGTLCLVERPDRLKGRCLLDIVNLWILKDLHSSVWFNLMKNVTLPLEGTELDETHSGVEEFPYDLSFVSSNGDILVMANDYEDPYIFSYSFLNWQFTRIKVVGTDSTRLPQGSKHVKGRVNPEKFLPRWCGRPVRAMRGMEDQLE